MDFVYYTFRQNMGCDQRGDHGKPGWTNTWSLIRVERCWTTDHERWEIAMGFSYPWQHTWYHITIIISTYIHNNIGIWRVSSGGPIKSHKPLQLALKALILKQLWKFLPFLSRMGVVAAEYTLRVISDLPHWTKLFLFQIFQCLVASWKSCLYCINMYKHVTMRKLYIHGYKEAITNSGNLQEDLKKMVHWLLPRSVQRIWLLTPISQRPRRVWKHLWKATLSTWVLLVDAQLLWHISCFATKATLTNLMIFVFMCLFSKSRSWWIIGIS